MKNKGLMQRILGVLLLSLQVLLSYAATPKFSIIPASPIPQGQIAANAVVTVLYTVINNTQIPRVLTMSPIPGVNQITNVPGACSYPFFLKPQERCTLVLQVIASATYGGVHSNIVVCKTMGPGDNRPDPFLCSQTDLSQGLQLSLGPIQPATITTNPVPPNELLFSIFAGGAVTVTNTDPNYSALNVAGSLPTNPNFTISSQCPAGLLPQQSCLIIYNSQVEGTAQSTIQGTNTNAVTLGMQAVKPTISVTAPPTFIVGNGGIGTYGQIIVTNTSANGAFAEKVTATITSGPFTVIATTCGNFLPPGNSCTITVNTNTNASVVNGTAVVQGLNTDPATISLTAQQTTISASPSSASVAVGQDIDVTITNTPPVPGNALNVQPQIPLGAPFTVVSSTCANFASTCIIKFKATGQTSGAVTIPIAGSNTTTTSVALTATMPMISVSPTNISLVNGNTATVTVSNPPTGSVAIPGGVKAYPLPPLSVSSTTCSGALNPGSSCQITFLAVSSQTATTVQSVPIYGANTNKVAVHITAGPAVLSLNPTAIVAGSSVTPPFSIGSTAVTNTSTGGNALNVAASIPSSAKINASTCPLIAPPPALACTMNFNYISFAAGLSGLSTALQVPIQGTNTTVANLYLAPMTISVTPSTITVGPNNTGKVTVNASGLTPLNGGFNGMLITIPVGSTISVANNGCATGIPYTGPSTGSCTIDFTGGPLVETQVITLQGQTNGVSVTNPTSFTANSVGQGNALIGFAGSPPTTSTSATINVDSAGGGTATLQITNNSTATPSPVTNSITATLPSSWTGVTAAYSSECANLAVGSPPTPPTCVITLTSATPNLAGKVQISAGNTNVLTANVAFQSGGGLIYDLSSGVSVVDLNDSSANQLAWGSYLETLATSKTDGQANQALILAADPTAPAALFCESYAGAFETGWYLPAIKELDKIYSGLALLGFGNFASTYYWSSTENDIGKAWYYNFVTPSGGANVDYKDITYNIRCVRKA